MTATVLTDEQVEFVEHGYLTLHDCFTRETAQPWLDRLDFRPTAAREDVVPDRVRRQERMAELEQGRLAEASS
jgi:hypothetical protein